MSRKDAVPYDSAAHQEAVRKRAAEAFARSDVEGRAEFYAETMADATTSPDEIAQRVIERIEARKKKP